MKKSELKELIKPIVQECVKESVEEILLESGLLSNVIKEVMKGALPMLVEASNKQPTTQPVKQQKIEHNSELIEQLKKDKQQLVEDFKKQNSSLLSMKVGNVDVFKGTTPSIEEKKVPGPLSNIAPNDPGVDISRLFGGKKFTI